jgi:sRNA-binding carbon storage regulator CsrA
MFCKTLAEGDRIQIGPVTVQIRLIRRGHVRLAIDAPDALRIQFPTKPQITPPQSLQRPPAL